MKHYRLDGVGKDVDTVVNTRGGKQSGSPYRFDLFPPLAAARVADILKTGGEKYGEWNYLNLSVGDNINHSLQHAFAYIAGDDSEKSLVQHLGHMACRALFALEIALREEQDKEVAGAKQAVDPGFGINPGQASPAEETKAAFPFSISEVQNVIATHKMDEYYKDLFRYLIDEVKRLRMKSPGW